MVFIILIFSYLSNPSTLVSGIFRIVPAMLDSVGRLLTVSFYTSSLHWMTDILIVSFLLIFYFLGFFIFPLQHLFMISTVYSPSPRKKNIHYCQCLPFFHYCCLSHCRYYIFTLHVSSGFLEGRSKNKPYQIYSSSIFGNVIILSLFSVSNVFQVFGGGGGYKGPIELA